MGDSDKKNLILAILLSVVVLMAWQFLYEAPRQEARQDALQAQQALDSEASPSRQSAGVAPQLGSEIPTELQSAADFPQSRAAALSETPRVTIESDLLRGSISLRGARIDDLVLRNYRETIEEDSDNIVLLTPHGGERPYYAEFGWLGQGVQTPDGGSVWTADRAELTPENPVTLRWTNDVGMVFEQEIALDEDYLFTITQRVANGGDETVAISPYGLISRTGTPETLGFYILHEGLLGVFDETLKEIDYDDLLESGREQQNTTGGWLGITDKYWLVALVPDQEKSVRTSFNAQAPGGIEKYQADFLTDAVSLAPRESFEMTSRLFAGAKITTLLDQYSADYGIANFDLAVDFGWFYWLTKPIFYAINWLNGVLGNFGLAILALTVGIKLAFFPLANKSYKSMSKMKLLQPKMVELKERYGDDRQKLNTEMMELYKKEKVNPLSGCLPILVQIPVFFALYKVLFVTIEMRHAPFFGWIRDLSAPDPLGLLTGFGLFPWEVPAILAILNIGIWPVIMGLTMYLQQKLNPAPADPVQAKIFLLMPFFFTFLLGTFPAGLVIYWAWNNSLSILQQYVIMRRMGVAIGGGKASDAAKS
ncbi:MAG: membrane protein insertase YidC [Alphaproteobacteria bacterium]|nr:membrane protein insertase YidC [Alphaproteobacteria bacterium]